MERLIKVGKTLAAISAVITLVAEVHELWAKTDNRHEELPDD